MRFALALHTDDGIAYSVTVPDLPGCFSAGKTLDHAIEMAVEAIDLHVEGLEHFPIELQREAPAQIVRVVQQAGSDKVAAELGSALIDAGETLPRPKALAEHKVDPLLADAIWAFVDVPVEKYFGKAEKINITVPVRLLERIDQYVRDQGETRSGFLTRAALRAMG